VASLIVNAGELDEQEFELVDGPNTIGRTQDNEVFVLHKSLSRVHARIVIGDDGAIIEDLGSKNGTFVDGVRVERASLRGAHFLKCGDVVFSFVPSGELARTASGAGDRDFGSPMAVYDPGQDPTRQTLAQLLRGATPSDDQTLASASADERLHILVGVSELLSSPAALDDVLKSIMDLAFRILDIDRGTLLLVADDGTLEPRVTKSRRDPDGAAGGYSRKIVQWVMSRRSSALFADTQADQRLADAASIVQQSICAAMCTPLRAKERVLGVLYVDNLSRPNPFDAGDLAFLSAFANQAAVAIDNALLRDALAEEAVARNTLNRFFAPGAIDTIMANGASLDVIETEATALFCDISGYTALSSQLAPRQVIELLNAYFPVMADIVFRHEGMLEKYIGDALLAVWGAPLSGPDDALRAVTAAIDMQRAMTGINAQLSVGQQLRVHVGINTGIVAAGNIGSASYLQYATIGDATNLAARICDVAAPGEILIDDATRHRIGRAGSWDLEPLQPVSVKGKAEPLQLHRVRVP